MNIIGSKEISGNKYFKILLVENNYTAETFTETYNRLYPDRPIVTSTVNSWSCGRRLIKNSSALTVQRIAHVLDDPDASEADFERYAGIVYHLVNGIRICIYENEKDFVQDEQSGGQPARREEHYIAQNQKGNEPEEEAN